MAMEHLLILLLVGIATATKYDYNDQSTWTPSDPCQSGKKQSPINIITPKSSTNVTALLEMPEAASTASLTNKDNVNTIKMEVGGNLKYKVVGKDVEATMMQVHLHWGEKNSEGSEHLLDGKPFSGELHLVSSYGDGSQYAVIGRFMQFKQGNYSYVNEELKALIDAQNATSGPSQRNIASFNLTAVFGSPATVSTYDGSLTTPGCAEVVYWQVISEPLYVGFDQIKQLKAIKMGSNGVNDTAVSHNNRIVKDLNNRTITCYRRSAASSHATTNSVISGIVLSLVVLKITIQM